MYLSYRLDQAEDYLEEVFALEGIRFRRDLAKRHVEKLAQMLEDAYEECCRAHTDNKYSE